MKHSCLQFLTRVLSVQLCELEQDATLLLAGACGKEKVFSIAAQHFNGGGWATFLQMVLRCAEEA